MTRTAPSRRGHRPQELAADPTGRFSSILRDRGDPWVAASLPLVFLAGLVFEIFLTLRDQVSAEITLNVVTVIGALGWLVHDVRR